MTCPHCQSTMTAHRSKTTQLGYRTFCCHACKRTFNERTGTPYNYLEFPTDIVLLVVLWRVRGCPQGQAQPAGPRRDVPRAWV